jgi:hypothetical protein
MRLKKEENMKKLAALLCVGSFALSFAACGGGQSASTTTSSTTTTTTSSSSTAPAVVGGWEIPESVTGTSSNEGAAAFEKAKESYQDPGLSAITEMGSQVVAGTNYMFLCKDMAKNAWKVATVYEDLSQKAEITNVADFDIGKYAQDDSGKAGEAGLAGGWTVFTDPSGQGEELPKEVAAAFDAVMEGMTGAEYLPRVYLGSQVVNGSNYAILCEQKLVTANPVTNLAVVYIYAPATGDPEIMNIYPLNLADFTK